jgi:hypothetical protein
LASEPGNIENIALKVFFNLYFLFYLDNAIWDYNKCMCDWDKSNLIIYFPQFIGCTQNHRTAWQNTGRGRDRRKWNM